MKTDTESNLPQIKSPQPEAIWNVGGLGEIEYALERICWIIAVVKAKQIKSLCPKSVSCLIVSIYLLLAQ